MTTIGVLALQGDVREHEDVLAACGVQTRKVRSADHLKGLDALVVPGGESTTISLLASSNGLVAPITRAIREGLPAYGSCAGMIMLAQRVEDGRPDQQTFGGLDVVVRRNAFGRQVDSFESDLTMPCLGPEPLHAVFIRAPWVESTGPDVEVLATIEGGSAAGRIVAVRQGNVLATSFHPELTGDPRVHRYFVEMVKQR